MEACCNLISNSESFGEEKLKHVTPEDIQVRSSHVLKELKHQVEPGYKWKCQAKTIPNSLNLGFGGNGPIT